MHCSKWILKLPRQPEWRIFNKSYKIYIPFLCLDSTVRVTHNILHVFVSIALRMKLINTFVDIVYNLLIFVSSSTGGIFAIRVPPDLATSVPPPLGFCDLATAIWRACTHCSACFFSLGFKINFWSFAKISNAFGRSLDPFLMAFTLWILLTGRNSRFYKINFQI